MVASQALIRAYVGKSGASLYAVRVNPLGRKGVACALVTGDTLVEGFEFFSVEGDEIRYNCTVASSKFFRRNALRVFRIPEDRWIYWVENTTNEGWAFEKATAEYLEATLSKNNLPFEEGGDYVLKDGTQVQAKGHRATLCKLERLGL